MTAPIQRSTDTEYILSDQVLWDADPFSPTVVGIGLGRRRFPSRDEPRRALQDATMVVVVGGLIGHTHAPPCHSIGGCLRSERTDIVGR
jgi:hypothetical protein